MNVLQAIHDRRSIRAFTDTPVADSLITDILDTARWSPSGVNSQPWQVAVVRGATQARITDALIEAREAGIEPDPDYTYYPTAWHTPYRERRKASGLARYAALGIGREDREAQTQAWYDNYRFFGAPVGLFFFIDAQLGQGSWIDMGMFIQSVMLAAQGHGLGSCPQASLAEYPNRVRDILGYPAESLLVCGMSLGHADLAHPANSYRTEREAVERFTRRFD